MPVVFREDGYRFHFFSDEGDPREPAHIHVVKDNADAKFWLYPEVGIAYNHGFNAVELNRLSKIILSRRGRIEEAWREHFS
jgi:hypothetical protein